MPKRNKTSDIDYRFLSSADFKELYRANLDAFSDYVVPLKMTEPQFKNHIDQNGVDLNWSVGAFSDKKMVGFTLNGFGLWNAKKTAYDAGTGVIPEFRKMGIGTAIFDFLLPKLREINVEQMLLEVIEENEKAFKLYKKLGFEKTRNLLFFEQGESLDLKRNENIEIREIEKPDWNAFKSFRDGETSWQFSSESIERRFFSQHILAAFLEKKLVGYGVVYPKSGMIAQLAVDKNHRRNRIASTLLSEMQKKSPPTKKIRFSNLDESLGIVEFLKALYFKQTLTQFEMIKTL